MSAERLDLSKEQAAIVRALKSAIAKAKAAGVMRPEIFVEGGGTIAVLDGDRLEATKRTADAVAGSMHVSKKAIGGGFDAGAW